ncbi:hypothetical protein SAMN05660199_02749 [Klenkia soli]|uniref:LPXTG-motif cell wall anchor domain-containing protein n=1 Tax=Klenkia soli TaxID=1052260 RepID=A0A1H0N6C5_9ACTN|nr:hypothetical protein [Klenkia soli]SDO87910.1 hypothetical protein SAMN05660199_02749 [Klenkia soli]
MPQLHPSRRTGRHLLAGGLLSAVVVLGTPAVASAADDSTSPLGSIPGLDQLPIPLPGAGTGGDDGEGDTGGDTSGAPALPGPDDLDAGAACVAGLVDGITVQVGEIVGGLTGILVGLTGVGSTTVGAEQTATIPMTPEEFLALLSPAQLQQLLAGGQESLTVGIPLVVEGVAGIVPVVFDFVSCLASLIPAATPTTVSPGYTPPAAAAPTTTVAPAITTSAAPTQAVAYPGYAPTGGAPSDDDGSPAALVGLGLLTAATGGGALWLRARRGVA